MSTQIYHAIVPTYDLIIRFVINREQQEIEIDLSR